MANTTIQIKKSGISGNVPSSLNFGEVALNYADAKLYYKTAGGPISYITNQQSFATINSNNSLVLATSSSDTLSFVPANGISITTDTVNKVITIGDGTTFNQVNAAFNKANTDVTTISVTPGSYGSSTIVPVITLESNGRISAISTATVSGGGGGSNYVTINTDNFTANGSATVFNLSATPPSSNNIIVNINGVPQLKSSYTIAGSTLTLSETPVAGTSIDVMIFLNGSNEANVATVGSYANSAFIQANAAFAQANSGAGGSSAGPYANAAFAVANSASIYANGAFIQANAAFLVANTPQAIANSASIYANGAFIQANASFGVANSASIYANGAFTKANNALPSTGGTISGSLTVTQDTTINGNLTVLGVQTTINTSSIILNDPLLFLANNNYSSDAVDIGLIGHYNAGANAHTGIFRDPNRKEWIFFQGYTTEVGANNLINLADPSFAYANVYASYFKGNVIANTVVVNGYDLFTYTTNAYTQANTATNNASGASLYANGAFVQANAAYSSQNTTGSYANSAYTQANTAATNAATADSKAVTAGSYANSAFGVANSAAIYANGAFVQANAAFIQANTPTAIANSAAIYANGAFAQANAAFDKANTGTTGGSSNSFSTIFVSGQPNVIANIANAPLTLVAGSGMTITTVGTSNTITFASTGGFSGGTIPNQLIVSNTTSSTSNATGAVIITGGLGVTGNVYIGSNSVMGFSNTTNQSVVYQVYNAANNSLDIIFA